MPGAVDDIWWLTETVEPDRSLIGGKASGLTMLLRAGARVPPGFVVTTAAFRRALPERVRAELAVRIEALPPEPSMKRLDRLGAELRALVFEAAARHPGRAAIGAAYERLCRVVGEHPAAVAVRSSSAAEDAAGASFAGEYDSYLWVAGEDDVQERIRQCWASLFTARAIDYRRRGAVADEAMAVLVQQMVPARAAGVLMTLNPANGDRSKIAIESVWGLGEPLVSGRVNPDRFLVDKVTGDIVKRELASKPTELVADTGGCGVTTNEIEPERRDVASLSDGQLAELRRIGRSIEGFARSPQDVEFATSGPAPDEVFIVQTRPETVWSRRPRPAVTAPGGGGAVEAVVSTLVGIADRTRWTGRKDGGDPSVSA
ncbi:MAG: PEP/pyruvate-binding domain-containing protein [Acidimicrobiales bacterium]